jgi:hypothetical protein
LYWANVQAECVYSPIQRLKDSQNWGIFASSRKLQRSTSFEQAGELLRTNRSCMMDAEDASTMQLVTSSAPASPDPPAAGMLVNKDTSAMLTTFERTYGERIAESAGATGDEFRFRYDTISPEESYSPIAGVRTFRPRAFSADMDARQTRAWLTHIDMDGAVCSQAIAVPLDVIVRLPDGGDMHVQVRHPSPMYAYSVLTLLRYTVGVTCKVAANL